MTLAIAGLARRALAELVGTGALVTVVAGSGIMAATLSRDVGVQLLANSLATAAALAVLGSRGRLRFRKHDPLGSPVTCADRLTLGLRTRSGGGRR
ncbi:hypothetical protein AB0J63_46020 [Streptosporangium canum]|uniref:hypothetical protein n=1 Tax=Streptosporangium canum TaxID=324952 RepID=UPI0034175E72